MNNKNKDKNNKMSTLINSTPVTGRPARVGRPNSLWRWLTQSRAESAWREVLQRAPAVYWAAEQIPDGIRLAWRRDAHDEFAGLRTDRQAWAYAACALAQFFEACRLQAETAGGAQPCALPSRAADSIWHVWLRVDAAGLASWQRACFGRVLPHVEADELGAPLEESLARTWACACRTESQLPRPRYLPLLFAVDGRLGVPGGWAYRHDPARGGFVHQDLDRQGRPAGELHSHAGLAVAAVLGLGLLTQAERELIERTQPDWELLLARREKRAAQQASADSGGSSCGTQGFDVWFEGGSDGAGAADGGGSDSGGSSCGSGCGGGGD